MTLSLSLSLKPPRDAHVLSYSKTDYCNAFCLRRAFVLSDAPLPAAAGAVFFQHRPNGYFAQRVPSLFLASSLRMCLMCEVLGGMFPWRTR